MQLYDITCLFIPTLSVFMGAIGTVKELCQNNEDKSFDGLLPTTFLVIERCFSSCLYAGRVSHELRNRPCSP